MATMEAKATARFVRISPRKVRRSVDLIRGRHVEDARRILAFSHLGPNPVLLKVLNSAVANAEQKDMIPENLVVARAFADEGPTLKRFRPRAYGRATKIRKRTSHITVVVEQLEGR
jgi:large subunit ribosomal protein L22